MTKVQNMTSPRGTKVANQFIITTDDGEAFQSYNSVIVFRPFGRTGDEATDAPILVDANYWNYSRTTSKYRSMFLGETTKDTQKKIDCGIYHLTNLNK